MYSHAFPKALTDPSSLPVAIKSVDVENPAAAKQSVRELAHYTSCDSELIKISPLCNDLLNRIKYKLVFDMKYVT